MSLRENLAHLPADVFCCDRVRITPIENENDLLYAPFDCRMYPEQKDLVNPASFSIGRAYLKREANVPCLIRDGQGASIGFISLTEWRGKSRAYAWSYFLDRNAQGHGCGKAAASLAVRILRAADPAMPIRLSTEADNEKAQRLYHSLGFRLLEEKDGDDLVFELAPEDCL